MIKDIIEVEGALVKAVKVKDDFFNPELNQFKLKSYFPNPPAREALYGIARGLHPTSKDRTHIVSGTYGCGKSHFVLVLANYVTKNSSSGEFSAIFNRLEEKDPTKASEIFNIRNVDKPYLLVLLEGYDMDGIEHALLSGLRDALQRKGVSDKELKTAYRSALEKIEEWKKDRPEFYDQLQQRINKTSDFDTFLNDLNNFKEGALSIFKEAYMDITTGSFEPLYTTNVVDGYQEICGAICKKGYKGIIIIWDQFNDHLGSMPPDKLGKDACILRNFAESIERGGEQHQIHLALVSHRALKDYLQEKGLRKETLEIWGTVQGRFKQWLLTAIEDAEELISYTITKKCETEEWKKVKSILKKDTKLKDWIIKLNIFQGKLKEWVQEFVMEGCYPLHPLATYCLPRISEAVSQQEYRTMFTFLGEPGKGGLIEFITKNQPFTADGKLNLYQVYMLFDFFEDDIKNSLEMSQIMKNYSAALKNVTAPHEPLTQALLKTICVLSVIKTKYPMMPILRTPEHLSMMLDVKETELEELMKNLYDKDVLWKKPNGEYDFRGTETPFNLEDDLTKTKSDLLWDSPIHILTTRRPPQDIIAEKYEREYYIERRLIGEYIPPEGLNNLSYYENQIKTEYQDGYIFYVIAESKSDIETARKCAISIKNPQIVISIPKDPIEIYEPLKNIETIGRLKEKPPYTRQEEEPYARLEEIEKHENEELQRALGIFTDLSGIELFWDGKTMPVSNLKALSDIASNVMNRVFYKTLIVLHKKMANIREQDQRTDRIKLNTAILDISKEEISYISKGGKVPAEKTILDQTLCQLNMIASRTDGNYTYYKLKEPTEGNIKEVWDLIESSLKKSNCNVGELIHKLRSPPYGISPRVIEILLSAFFYFNRPCFAIKTKRTKNAPWEHKDFTGETIYEVLTSESDRVLIEYREDPPYGEKYRKIIYEKITRQRIDAAHLDATEVGKKLLEWYQSLPTITKKSLEHSESTKTLCSELNTISGVTEIDMRAVVCEKLPIALGIEKKFELWDNSDLNIFEEKFAKVVDELINYPEIIKGKVKNVLRDVFNIKGDIEQQIISKIGDWYGAVPSYVKESKNLSRETKSLLKHTDIKKDTTIEKTFMNEMPSELGLEIYENWTDIENTLMRYTSTLKKAKKEIDEMPKYVGPKKEKEKKKASQYATELENALRNIIRKATKVSGEEKKMILEKLLGEWK